MIFLFDSDHSLLGILGQTDYYILYEFSFGLHQSSSMCFDHVAFRNPTSFSALTDAPPYCADSTETTGDV